MLRRFNDLVTDLLLSAVSLSPSLIPTRVVISPVLRVNLRMVRKASETALRAAEQARRDAAMDAEAAEETRQGLENLVRDLKAVVQPSSDAGTVTNDHSHANIVRGGDGENLFSPPSTVTPASRETARRILSLSEELRAAKLEASELRRHVASLREDRRHLERKLANTQAMARDLEVAKAEAETRAVLASGGPGGDDGVLKLLGSHTDGVDLGDIGLNVIGDGGGGNGSSDRAAKICHNRGSNKVDILAEHIAEDARERRSEAPGEGLSDEEQKLFAAVALPAEVDFGGLDPEETLKRLQDLHARVC